jgi:hypothetical protein
MDNPEPTLAINIGMRFVNHTLDLYWYFTGFILSYWIYTSRCQMKGREGYDAANG